MEFATYMELCSFLGISVPDLSLVIGLGLVILVPFGTALALHLATLEDYVSFETGTAGLADELPEEREYTLALHERAVQERVKLLQMRADISKSGLAEAPEPGFVKPVPSTYRGFVSELVASCDDMAELEWLCQVARPTFLASFTGGHKKSLDWVQAKARKIAA